MYLSRGGQLFGAGHASAGVADARTTWFLAEGATGSFFDEFVLIANPTGSVASVRITYLLPGGQRENAPLPTEPDLLHPGAGTEYGLLLQSLFHQGPVEEPAVHHPSPAILSLEVQADSARGEDGGSLHPSQDKGAGGQLRLGQGLAAQQPGALHRPARSGVLLQQNSSCSRLGCMLGSHGARRAGAYDRYVEVVHDWEKRWRALVLTFS